MKKGDVEKYIGKSVKLILKNDWVYTGTVLAVYDESLDFKARDDQLVTISLDSISVISAQEENK